MAGRYRRTGIAALVLSSVVIFECWRGGTVSMTMVMVLNPASLFSNLACSSSPVHISACGIINRALSAIFSAALSLSVHYSPVSATIKRHGITAFRCCRRALMCQNRQYLSNPPRLRFGSCAEYSDTAADGRSGGCLTAKPCCSSLRQQIHHHSRGLDHREHFK